MCRGRYGSVCSELSEFRRERGLTQAELAEALSVGHPAISRLEAAASQGSVSGSDFRAKSYYSFRGRAASTSFHPPQGFVQPRVM